MSFDHPSAPTNSAGQERDPIKGTRLDKANKIYDEWGRRGNPFEDQNPFQSWQRFTEDMLHYRTLDSLPQGTQDAIRIRRQRNLQESDIPWIVQDTMTLLTALDDIDDLTKTMKFGTRYILTPAAKAARRLRKGKNPFRDERLTGWDTECGLKVPPRQRKQAIPKFGGLNLLSVLGLAGVAALFPEWAFFALALQAAQTMDNFFGVGLQLGPALGWAAEVFFRGLSDAGGPLFTFENKWEQLKAARITAKANKSMAAAPSSHPDDAMTSLTGLYYSSDRQFLPHLVIAPDDYPSLSKIIQGEAELARQTFNLARLAASLPYNLGAEAVNQLLGDTMTGWSEAVGGAAAAAAPDPHPDNETEVLMHLAELGICPNDKCEAELLVDAMLLANPDQRVDQTTRDVVTERDLARKLKLSVADPVPPTTP